MKERHIFSLRSVRAAVGIALGAVAALGSAYACTQNGRLILLVLGLAAAAGFVASGALRIPSEGWPWKLAAVAWYCLALFTMFFASQVAVNHGFTGIEPKIILLNVLCVALPFCALLTLTARPRLSLWLTWAPLCLLSAINYCVQLFRGSGVTPFDFRLAGVALEVLPNYHFVMTASFFLSLCLWALIPFSSLCFALIRPKRRLPLRAAGAAATLALGLFCFSGCADLRITYGTDDTIHRGFLATFVARAMDTFRDYRPEGYSLERVAAIEARYAQPEDAAPARANGEAPNVIVIMSEAFSDLAVYGSAPNAGPDPIPFFHSLKENAIRGYALSSVYGSLTDHSEYSCLTGNLLEGFEAGTTVYAGYIHEPIYSLVSALKGQGYRCLATHPFRPTGYRRNYVYPLLGFDEATFLDDYPQQDLVRNYVSDQEMFEYLIRRCEEESPKGKLFLFGVTMQNHGGYDYEGPNYERTVSLEGYSRDYPEAEQYLSLLRESDRALEYLVSYLEGIDTPTVLLFFGDHQPNLGMELPQELHGGPLSTLDERQLQYAVPFLVWANYDIEERDVGLTSLNYLSNYLYEAAGMELPAYNRFLRDMQAVIPAINIRGYYSAAQGRFLPFDEAEGEEAAWLSDYDVLQYNSLFDSEHRSERFFPLPEGMAAK